MTVNRQGDFCGTAESNIKLKRWVTMTIVEISKSAQFVVDNKGRRTAVLLSIQAWEAIVNWIEDVADIRIASQVLPELQAAGGRPQQAGWLAWDDIREEWSDGRYV